MLVLVLVVVAAAAVVVVLPTGLYVRCRRTQRDCNFGVQFLYHVVHDHMLIWQMERSPSEHTLHMSKPVIMFVFKVLRNGLLRYIL